MRRKSLYTELATEMAQAFVAFELPRTEEASNMLYEMVREQLRNGETPNPYRCAQAVKRKLMPV